MKVIKSELIQIKIYNMYCMISICDIDENSHALQKHMLMSSPNISDANAYNIMILWICINCLFYQAVLRLFFFNHPYQYARRTKEKKLISNFWINSICIYYTTEKLQSNARQATVDLQSIVQCILNLMNNKLVSVSIYKSKK